MCLRFFAAGWGGGGLVVYCSSVVNEQLYAGVVRKKKGKNVSGQIGTRQTTRRCERNWQTLGRTNWIRIKKATPFTDFVKETA